MFFHTIIHSLINTPKELYQRGIDNCKVGVSVPLASASKLPLNIQAAKLPKVQSTITRKLKLYFPSVSESFVSEYENCLSRFLTEEYWSEGKKTEYIIVNGYEATTNEAVMYITSLSNEKVSSKSVFKLFIQRTSGPSTYSKSFTELTTFTVADGHINNIHQSESVDLEMVKAASPAVSPFLFGSALLANYDFLEPSINFIARNTDTLAKDFGIEQETLDSAIAKYKKEGSINFNEIVKNIREFCFATPTPEPEPETAPETELETEQTEVSETEEETNKESRRKSQRGTFRRSMRDSVRGQMSARGRGHERRQERRHERRQERRHERRQERRHERRRQ